MGVAAITVERVASAKLPTQIGDFRIAGYRSLTSSEEFIVLYKGELDGETQRFVIDSQCLTGDVFGSVKCDCGPQLHRAMEMMKAAGRGAIVYQQQEGRGHRHHQQDDRIHYPGKGRRHGRGE